MRKRIAFTTILLCLIHHFALAQWLGGDHIYAVAKAGTPLPLNPPSVMTNNSQLNNIFNSFGVTSYQLAFTGATDAALSATYEIYASGNINTLRSVLSSTGFFDLVELSSTYKTIGCTSPVALNDPWPLFNWTGDVSLDLAEAQCAWSLTRGNPNLVVAVVDEEIDPNHPDFAGKVSVMSANTVPTGWSHGIATTGVVCAQTNNGIGTASIGYNLHVNFYSVRALGLEKAMWNAYSQGAKVINISYIMGWSTTSVRMLQDMIKGGCTPVFGAGNDAGTYHQGIWNVPGAIIVSGVDQDNRHVTTQRHTGAPHSAYPGVDLCAVSVGVSTVTKTSSGFDYADGWGTSYAAPQVTATIGLMLSVNPCLRPEEIESILKSTTEPILDAASYPGLLGTGRLNAYRAVLKAQQWGTTDLIVSSGQVVTITGYEYYRNIIVQNGGQLNVNDAQLFIANGGRVTIECNAKMYVTNSTIQSRKPTPDCVFPQYQWEGIVINGAPSRDQTTANQGYIAVTNSTIRDAKNALSTTGLNAAGNIDWSKTGGAIIIGYNSTFTNNGRHVELMAYSRPGGLNNVCRFTACTFELEGSVDITNPANHASVMITAWGVKGVRFTGCTFRNTNGSVSAGSYGRDRGTGILTLDAAIIVEDQQNSFTCVSIRRGHFYDLSKGIIATNTPSGIPANVISRQDFERNDRGIMLVTGLGSTIHHNSFNLDVPSNYYNRQQSTYDPLYRTGILGVYTDRSSGFRVEENTFSLSSKIPGQVVAGAVIDNTNTGSGIFRLNTMSGLNQGLQLQRNNANLTVSCNMFQNNWAAMQLNIMSITGKTPYFGECDPVNATKRNDYVNRFVSNSADVSNYTAPVKTYVIKNLETQRPSPWLSAAVDVANCETRGKGPVTNLSCALTPELQNGCGLIADINPSKQKYYAAKAEVNIIRVQISNGGDQQLMSLLSMGPNIPANIIYNELISRSPYLSDAAMISMLQNCSHIGEGALVDILVQNSALSQDVQNAVNVYPFSPNAVITINDAQNIVPSPRDQANDDLNFYEIEMAAARDEVIQEYNFNSLADESGENEDELMNWLEQESDFTSIKMLVGLYYNRGNLDMASQYLSMIEAVNEGDEETNRFIQFYQTLLNAGFAGRNLGQLDENEWAVINDISTSNSTAGASARGMLTFFKGAPMDVYVERDYTPPVAARQGNPNEEPSTPSAQLFIYPNPSYGNDVQVVFNAEVPGNTIIRLLDVSGKEVENHVINTNGYVATIQTEGLANGIYFVQALCGDRILDSVKLVIAR